MTSLNIDQCAALLAVSTDTVRAMVAADQIPHFRARNSIRFVSSQVEEWALAGGTRQAEHATGKTAVLPPETKVPPRVRHRPTGSEPGWATGIRAGLVRRRPR